MIKRLPWLFAIVLCLFLLSPTQASAQGIKARSPGATGVGLGAATLAWGLSLKFPDGNTALQAVIGPWRGWGWGGCGGGGRWDDDDWCGRDDAIAVAGDYLFPQPALVSGEVGELAWNYGIGGGVGLGEVADHLLFGLGVSGVAGLEFNVRPIPIDLVLEYRPGIYFFSWWEEDEIDFEFFDLTAHIRVYF